jgi:hypothetical protein
MYTVRTRFYTNVYIVLAQSLEVSKIKKNKKTSKNFGHLPLFIIDDQTEERKLSGPVFKI